MLKSELNSEVQLPHRSVRVKLFNHTAVRTIDTVIRGAEVNLVEHVEGLEPELPSDALSNREVLEQR